jgi:hypothetical protein
MRLKGTWLSQDADLPKKGEITIDGSDGGYSISLAVEDTFGFGFMDRGTRKKYERVLDNIAFSFGASIEASAGSGAPREVTTELERLASLRDGGALTEDEFQSAKSKVLGSS